MHKKTIKEKLDILDNLLLYF